MRGTIENLNWDRLLKGITEMNYRGTTEKRKQRNKFKQVAWSNQAMPRNLVNILTSWWCKVDFCRLLSEMCWFFWLTDDARGKILIQNAIRLDRTRSGNDPEPSIYLIHSIHLMNTLDEIVGDLLSEPLSKRPLVAHSEVIVRMKFRRGSFRRRSFRGSW